MGLPLTLEEFNELHPYPDKADPKIYSLYRFYKIDLNHLEYLEQLFLDKKLYHPLPCQLNDPFECKPHIIFDKHGTLQHIKKLAKAKGLARKEIKVEIAEFKKNKNHYKKIGKDASLKALSEVRICSFTAKKDNLLLWSHYADSHKGFCVEFDATRMPLHSAYKVRYDNEYPSTGFAFIRDIRVFIPALSKSRDWEYEQEFRTLYMPGQKSEWHYAEGLNLKGHEIKNIYLGASMEGKEKNCLLRLIEEGPFKPSIWVAKLKKSTFGLDYERIG